MKYQILSIVFVGLFIAGCAGIGGGQPQAKDCGFDYRGCLLPAEQSCTPAFGKLDNGAVVMSERIFGPEGDNCKLELKVESPASVQGLSASCNIPKSVLSTKTKPPDSSGISDLCKYCSGTMIDKFKASNAC